MYASMVPFEAASKHSSGCMIWPLGKTSIRKRPPLVSSTTCASRWAAPCRWSSVVVHVVDIRHWTFGWALTLGASTTAVTTAASPPLASSMNLRRPLIAPSTSHRDELMVRAFGHVVPRAHQRLELRERRVHL